jgi:hypothetical protein
VRTIFFALFALLALVYPAVAKEKALGSFGVWNTYANNDGGQMVCYMVTTNTVKSTGPAKRTSPYLMITHRPTEASRDVISYGAGANLNAKRGVRLHIGKDAFDLFSVRDTAWARDALTDHKIAAALRKTATVTLTAFADKKGHQPIKDSFALTGTDAAYRAIGKACGYPEAAPHKAIPAKPKKPYPAKSKKAHPAKATSRVTH